MKDLIDERNFREKCARSIVKSYNVHYIMPDETEEKQEEVVVTPDHTLFGEYPPKIPEDEIKPMDESGEIVLSRVVIPEYVVVDDKIVLLPKIIRKKLCPIQ